MPLSSFLSRLLAIIIKIMSETLLHLDTLFTNIGGYTALMGSDEDRAFETLRKNREIRQRITKNTMEMLEISSSYNSYGMLTP